VLIGSGADWENIPQLMKVADGVIVSSSLKRHGKRENPIDPIRVSRFVEAARRVTREEVVKPVVTPVKLHS
jgi:predicted TIM-barrel enzyme